MKLFSSLFYGSTFERETTMMKRVFIFLLALALFIAITGGYGQIINSDWVARSFISADQRAEEYPQLEKDVAYKFYMTDGKTYHGGDGNIGFVIEQKGKWLTLERKSVDSYNNTLYGHYYHCINLDNVCAIEHYEKLETPIQLKD
jgi:hypothetical protein